MRSFVYIIELEHSWKCYHIHIHLTNAPFTHSIWRLPTQITLREWIIRSSHKRRRFAGVAQLFRRQLCARLCGWKLCILGISSAGSKTLWVTHLLHSWPIVPTLWTYSSTSDLTPYIRKRIEPWSHARTLYASTTQVNMKQKLWYLRVFLPRGTQLVFSSEREVVGPQDEYLSWLR
jgi:hypothetical protein